MTFRKFREMTGRKRARRRYIAYRLDYPVWVVKRRWLSGARRKTT